MQTTAKLGATEMRWAAKLAQFTFTIKYRSGRSNRNADALSRKLSHGEELPVARLEEVTSDFLQALGEGAATIVPECVRVRVRETAAGPLQKESHLRPPSLAPKAMLTFPCISSSDMTTMQRGYEMIGRLWYYWEQKHPPTLRQLMKEPKTARKLLREWKRITERDGVLYRGFQLNGQEIRQLILAGSLKSKVLSSVHDDLRHQAVEKTTVIVRIRCY